MRKKIESRKDFIKKTALTLGFASLATVGVFAVQNEETIAKLPEEQQQFIRFYKQWLNKFKNCAERQKVNPNDTFNNKAIVKLSEESKLWKVQLRKYMTDPIFSAYFAQFTADTTEQIPLEKKEPFNTKQAV